MGDKSGIQWTDATWNPIRGCSRVSEGCRNCYAERTAIRQVHIEYAGYVKSTPSGPRWTGEVDLMPQMLNLPLGWKKPRRVFVNSMSDLFHESLSPVDIGRVFNVMGSAERHTFQVLTKRPQIMRDVVTAYYEALRSQPFPNVHLGVSVEHQAAADERIPLLLQTPAAVRFLSVEPLLGPVDLELDEIDIALEPDGMGQTAGGILGPLHWVIAGGESGPGARPCDLAWIRSIVAQCKAAGVPVFVKQLGPRPFIADLGEEIRLRPAAYHVDLVAGSGVYLRLRDRKGGDMAEWPEDLRVREFPA